MYTEKISNGESEVQQVSPKAPSHLLLPAGSVTKARVSLEITVLSGSIVATTLVSSTSDNNKRNTI